MDAFDVFAGDLAKMIGEQPPAQKSDPDRNSFVIDDRSWLSCIVNSSGLSECAVHDHASKTTFTAPSRRLGEFSEVVIDPSVERTAIVGGDVEIGLVTVFPRPGNAVHCRWKDGTITLSRY